MSEFDFTSFLKLMVHKKASDLFITAGVAPSMKVQGRIVPITQSPLSAQQSRDMVINVMTPSQREEFEKTHECQFAISAQGVGRFRVSCFYQRNCVGMVLRRIEAKIPTIEELGLPPVIKQLAMTKRGIIIFVGATGTGKSTSLASMVGYRNQNSTGHIITIEDPIEYVHKHEGCIITQRELGIDTDSWENALKNTLRQAPDVILIGEVRTRETMEYAINFAETGHLVPVHACTPITPTRRSTASCTSSRKTVASSCSWILSLNLKGIVAQQLIPTPDGKARRVAMEVMLGTPLVQDYIRQGEIHKLKEVMKESTNLGMMTFDQSLVSSTKLARSATRMRCATPTAPTKCACASSSRRAATRIRCRRAWKVSRSKRIGRTRTASAAASCAVDRQRSMHKKRSRQAPFFVGSSNNEFGYLSSVCVVITRP